MTTSYEGRPLPRPDEEVVDQGLRFDLDTLLSRRRVLGFLGIGAAGLGLVACGGSSTSTSAAASSTAATTSSGEIPEERPAPTRATGPTGERADRERDRALGHPLELRLGLRHGRGRPDDVDPLTVQDMANGVPFEGAAVYVWHCDRDGNYSLYSRASPTRTTCAACRSPTPTGR